MVANSKKPQPVGQGGLTWEQAQAEILARIGARDSFVRAVFSGRRRNYQPDFERVDIRPVQIKDEIKVQITSTNGKHQVVKNYSFSDFTWMNLLQSGFANFLVESRQERFEVRVGKKGQVFAKSSRANLSPSYEHDHKKQRFLEANDSFLIAVGISDVAGRIKPSMRDKYLQVEEFLRILDSSLGMSATKSPIRLVDLGCGHAYLTFAAFRYFQLKEIAVSLVGVDVKEETRIRNEKIAKMLQISSDVKFVDSTISEFPLESTDIAVALHACDTATDDALAWAVNSGAKLILAAPCCHHDLHEQVKRPPEAITQVFEHGILAVRQVDILTDALRAAILNCVGYKADVFEFISGDHTARNLMIRATFQAQSRRAIERNAEKLREYRHTCELWGIKPALESRLKLGDFPVSD